MREENLQDYPSLQQFEIDFQPGAGNEVILNIDANKPVWNPPNSGTYPLSEYVTVRGTGQGVIQVNDDDILIINGPVISPTTCNPQRLADLLTSS